MGCIGGGAGQQEGRGGPPVAHPRPSWCLPRPTRLARRPSPASRRRPRPRTARAASVESPTGMARRSGKVRKKSGGRPPCAAGSEGGRCVCVAACVRAGEAAAGVVPAARLTCSAETKSCDKLDGSPQRGLPHRGGVPPTRRRCRLAGTLGARWVSVKFEAEQRCSRSALRTARRHISGPGATRCAPACRPVCQTTAVQPCQRQPAARPHGPAGSKPA